MKFYRKPERHLALFYTRDCTIQTTISAVMFDKPQFIVRECVYSLRMGIAYSRTKSVYALINLGTDVNAEGDLCVRRCLPPHSDITYIESVMLGWSGTSTVFPLLLRAGALITFNVLKILIGSSPRVNIYNLSLFLAHINRYSTHYTCGGLEDAVKRGDTSDVQELLDSRAVITLEIIRLIVNEECSQEITDLILRHVNK